MKTSAFEALQAYILETTSSPEAITKAREDAVEFGLAAPDAMTGALLCTLAAGMHNAIAVTPAAGVVGLYLMEGMGEQGQLTCIDPETEHQRQAKEAFRQAGHRSGAFRFLPSRPLDVMHRLAAESYDIVYGDVDPADLSAFVEAAWPLLRAGGKLVLADCLLDGAIAEQRNDRDLNAAREADAMVREMEDAHVVRLPLGAGMTILSKK